VTRRLRRFSRGALCIFSQLRQAHLSQEAQRSKQRKQVGEKLKA
jgi:hypothetical protein